MPSNQSAANPAWRRGLQSLRPVRRVAELGSFGHMNTRRTRVIWLMISGVSLVLALGAFCIWTPPGIQRHRRFVEDSRIQYAKPANIRELFSAQTLGWLRQRGTTAQERAERGKEHEDALIRIGYFERRSFSYTNVDAAAFIQAVHNGPLRDPLCYFRFDNGVVEVLAYKDDFERIERLLREHEKKT